MRHELVRIQWQRLLRFTVRACEVHVYVAEVEAGGDILEYACFTRWSSWQLSGRGSPGGFRDQFVTHFCCGCVATCCVLHGLGAVF